MSLEEKIPEQISAKDKLFQLFGVKTEEELKNKFIEEEIGRLMPTNRDFNEFINNIKQKEITVDRAGVKTPVSGDKDLTADIFEAMDELYDDMDGDHFLGFENFNGEVCIRMKDGLDDEIFHFNHKFFSERVSNILKNSQNTTYNESARKHMEKKYKKEKQILDSWPKKLI